MKKAVSMVCLAATLSVMGQRAKTNVIKSTNIAEIEAFLKTAHPDDPRRSVLKPRLVALKNNAWMKGSKLDGSQTLQPVASVQPALRRNNTEAEEFKRLLAESSGRHTEKTVKILNQLFNSDVSSKEAILLIENRSDCNMIVRIQGRDSYNLAVPAHGENSLVMKKGEYVFRSNVCDAQYVAAKHIEKSTLVTLNRPPVQLAVKNQGMASGASN